MSALSEVAGKDLNAVIDLTKAPMVSLTTSRSMPRQESKTNWDVSTLFSACCNMGNDRC